MSSVLETYIEPSAIALYDYEPTAVDDLSFSVSSSHVFVCNIKPDFFPCNQTFSTTETSGKKVPPELRKGFQVVGSLSFSVQGPFPVSRKSR